MPEFIILVRDVNEAVDIQQQVQSVTGASCVHILEADGGKYNISCYHRLAEKLEDFNTYLCPGTQTPPVVIVDKVGVLGLSPLSESPWDSIIAMLILTFPEYQWRFSLYTDVLESDARCRWRLNEEGLSTILSEPLFDAEGLRSYIRKRTIKYQYNMRFLPTRVKRAVSIDDESAFAHFHAYSAYRYGYRTTAIDSDRDAQNLLKQKEKGYDLTLEDIYLSFPDAVNSPDNTSVQFSRLKQRDSLFGALHNSKNRIFITTGQEGSTQIDRQKILENKRYLAAEKSNNETRKICYKPTGGVFGLWIESGLMQKLRGDRKKRRTQGYAEGFIWPPESKQITHENHGHSAPGRLLGISDRLRARAIKILNNSTSVEESVHAAVLATDALELLGGRTPTSSLEALSLKHRAEVTAECQFLGTQYNLCIKPRLEELHRDVQYIGQWFNPKTREHAANNAELCVITELAKIFRENAQFDEEQQCLNRVRELHRKLWFKNHPWFNYFLIPRATQWYIDFLLKSLGHFVMAVTAWMLVFTALYWCCSDGFTQGFQYAVSSFFSGTPSSTNGAMDIHNGWQYALKMIGMVIGMLHFGVFINHLFSISNRR